MFTACDSNLGGIGSRLKMAPAVVARRPLFRFLKRDPQAAKVKSRAAWTRRIHVGVKPSGFFRRKIRYAGGLALAEYEYDGTLGKFKLKKAFKKVVKTAGKLAAAPTAAGLQAVGLKKYSSKLGKAVGYTKGEMNVVRSAGKGIQYAAAATGAVMLAPAAGAAFASVGKGAMVGGKLVGGKLLGGGKFLAGKFGAGGKLLKKGVGLFGGLLKKAPKTVEEAAAQSEEVAQAAQNAGLITASAPEQTPAPQSPFAPPDGAGAPGGGAGASGGANAPGSGDERPPEGSEGSGVTTAGLGDFPGKIPPVMVIAAVAALALSLPKFAKGRR